MIDLNFLINSKNKSSRNWGNHNFLFKKISNLIGDKLNELNNKYENILLLSSDCDEAFTSVTEKNFKNLLFVSPYNELLKKIEFDKNNIQKIEGHFENLPLENGKFDLIINNLCLHSINDKHNHLKKLYDLLTKDGLFLCNFFGEKTLFELKTSLFQADEKIFNGIFMRLPTNLKMVEISDLLSQIGFKELVSEKISYKIYYNHVRKLLEDLKGIGESSYFKKRKKGMMTNTYIETLNKFYENNYGNENGLEISCDVVSVCGWKNNKT